MSITEERKKTLNFSDSYYNSEITIVTKSDNTTINSVIGIQELTQSGQIIIASTFKAFQI